MCYDSFEEEEIVIGRISYNEFFKYVISLDKRISELEKKLKNIECMPFHVYENIKERKIDT